MSEEEIKASIHGLYDALIAKNIDKALSFFADDAVLTWGPYKFQGKEEIKRWIIELGEMSQKLWFSEKNLVIREYRVTTEFFMGLLTPDGKRGLIPGTGVYDFKDGRIQQIKVNLSYGYVAVK